MDKPRTVVEGPAAPGFTTVRPRRQLLVRVTKQAKQKANPSLARADRNSRVHVVRRGRMKKLWASGSRSARGMVDIDIHHIDYSTMKTLSFDVFEPKWLVTYSFEILTCKSNAFDSTRFYRIRPTFNGSSQDSDITITIEHPVAAK